MANILPGALPLRRNLAQFPVSTVRKVDGRHLPKHHPCDDIDTDLNQAYVQKKLFSNFSSMLVRLPTGAGTMGHLAGTDIYRLLGEKVDNLAVRTPWNDALHAILSELYSPEEADVIIRMPYTLAPFERIEKSTRYEKTKLKNILEKLCSKGLVIDLCVHDSSYYMPSPMVVGIFECTMMQVSKGLDNTKKLSRHFHEYLLNSDAFYAANFGSHQRVSPLRTLPHEESIKASAYTEVLDYEKARSLIEASDRFAIGLCSCRHTMEHAGKKQCTTPLATCSQFGIVADFVIRNGICREVSKTEMLENLSRSKELGLVINADNTQRNIAHMCHCCGCCCHFLLGISKFGYPNTVVTSTLIAENDMALCAGCGKCAQACPINAVAMVQDDGQPSKRKKKPLTDASLCIGCGVCALQCKTGALKLVKRGQRVIHPETTFERILLQCLERGTLQNQLFDEPGRVTHQFMRGLLGGFFKLNPVKRALMSDVLRSSFLHAMKKGLQVQGRGWITEL
jgi:ferredoxin